MSSVIGDSDLGRMRALLAESAADDRPGDGLPQTTLSGLADLVACDLLSFFDFDPTVAAVHLDQDFDGGRVAESRVPDDSAHPFWRHFWRTESCSYPDRTGDDRTVVMLSDFYSESQWCATPMYADVFRDDGIRHTMMCSLPRAGTRSRRVIFFRSRGRDFDERDRAVLALLRPHLAEIHARRSAPGKPQSEALTARQRELLRLVAAGRSTAQIAEDLFLSPRTVRKHLENIFARLEVTNRTTAVLRAFADD